MFRLNGSSSIQSATDSQIKQAYNEHEEDDNIRMMMMMMMIFHRITVTYVMMHAWCHISITMTESEHSKSIPRTRLSRSPLYSGVHSGVH